MMTLQDGATVGPEDRQAWLAARRSGIGASEAAAVLGLSSYTTPRELYARKLGLTPDVEVTEAMRRGQHMERFLADEYRRRFPEFSLVEQVTRVHPDHPWMFATLDGVRSDGVIVEFKTANWRTAAKWGEEYSDNIPDAYTCQAQHQMAVSRATMCHVWASVGGDNCQLHLVERNDRFIDHLIRECQAFWQRVLDRDPPPATTAQDARLHHLLYPELDGTIQLSTEANWLVEVWQAAKESASDLDKQAGQLKARVLDLLGSASAGALPDGRTLTAKIVNRKGYTAVVKDTTYTDLRIKKAGKRHGE